MDDNSQINEELGLSKEKENKEIQLSHTIDSELVDPQDTDTSDIGFKGIEGIVNLEIDEETVNPDADDLDLDISMINGMLYQKYIEEDSPFPSDRSEWIRHILNSKNTDQYKIWYTKSHEKNAYPFDSARGFIYWDFSRELVFYIELNKDTYTNHKYPLCINVIGFENVLNIEMYHNMVDEKK